ncbi:hypothetical protein [Fibrella aquatica]|uniref:hypothetical protein n=1 Tax=Fibrella aquatica TaxID=3242487 RepID=UPI003521ED36
MQIAAHVLAYNVNRFIEPVIRNLSPHVDKVYIAHSDKPWGYVESSRLNAVNPTTLSSLKDIALKNSKVEIICGDWVTEEDMRNDCLSRARNEGFDWLIVQDADEFYTDQAWNNIKKTLLSNKSDNSLKTTWYNFWKSSDFVLVYPNDSIKHTNASFAIRCSSDEHFMRKRLPFGDTKVIDCACYHYGYVMSDEEMFDKISTWGHANELFSNKWYVHKWLNWSEKTKNLHPILPASWQKAIRFPLEQPEFALQFSVPLTNDKILNFGNLIGNEYYDAKVNLNSVKNYTKNVVKSILK